MARINIGNVTLEDLTGEFVNWIIKTKPLFEKIHESWKMLERTQHEVMSNEQCGYYEKKKKEYVQSLGILIEELENLRLKRINDSKFGDITDRYWLANLTCRIYQLNMVCMEGESAAKPLLRDCFEILGTNLRANLLIKQLNGAELADSKKSVWNDERSSHLVWWLIQVYMQAGKYNFAKEKYPAAMAFYQEVNRLYHRQTKKPVPYLYPLDLFELDVSALSLESMLSLAEMNGENEKKNHMLERMHNFNTSHLIDAYEKLKKDDARFVLMRQLLKDQLPYLNDGDRSIMDHTMWCHNACKLIQHLISHDRHNDAYHIYCIAVLTLDDAPDEKKVLERWEMAHPFLRFFGLKLCARVFDKTFTLVPIAKSERLTDDPRVLEMESESLPISVKNLDQAKLALKHATKAFSTVQSFYTYNVNSSVFIGSQRDYISIWVAYGKFESDPDKKEKLLKKVNEMYKGLLASIPKEKHVEVCRHIADDLGELYLEHANEKRNYFMELSQALEDFPTPNGREQLEQLRIEVNTLVFKAIQAFHKTLTSFRELKTNRPPFTEFPSECTKDVTLCRLPTTLPLSVARHAILTYDHISKLIFMHISLNKAEQVVFAHKLIFLTTEVINYLERNKAKQGHLFPENFVTNVYCVRNLNRVVLNPQ